MRTTTRLSAVMASLLSLGALPVMAQSANITATATVLQAIIVTGARTLDFDTVFPGVAKSIGVAAATSGRYDLTGSNRANVNVSFTLPTKLTSGANTLTIDT